MSLYFLNRSVDGVFPTYFRILVDIMVRLIVCSGLLPLYMGHPYYKLWSQFSLSKTKYRSEGVLTSL